MGQSASSLPLDTWRNLEGREQGVMVRLCFVCLFLLLGLVTFSTGSANLEDRDVASVGASNVKEAFTDIKSRTVREAAKRKKVRPSKRLKKRKSASGKKKKSNAARHKKNKKSSKQ